MVEGPETLFIEHQEEKNRNKERGTVERTGTRTDAQGTQ
jgi:hypothetical protein